MKTRWILFLAAVSILACDKKDIKAGTEPATTSARGETEAQPRKAAPALPEKKAAGDPVDKVQDPGQKLVFIFAEATKRAERNPEHCGAAWEDMEAYLNSRKKDLHQAVVAIIQEAVADPEGSKRKMKQISALGKELFGGEGNPMAKFEKRCPKEKDLLRAWLNKSLAAAAQEGMKAAQEKMKNQPPTAPQVAK